MPCMDGGPSAAQLADEQRAKDKKAAKLKAERQRLDDVTRMLCTLGNAVLGCRYDFEKDIGVERAAAIEIEEWLHNHNEADKKRRKKEEAAAKKKADAKERSKTQLQLKKSALDKLTPRERKALGL